jgi:hypothetical protein
MTLFTVLYFHLLTEIVANFMLSYGFSGEEVSQEYFYSQLFLSLGDNALVYLLLHLVYMFVFGLLVSFILTRHFTIISQLIRDFLEDPKDANVLVRSSFYSKKYALARFINLFFQALKNDSGANLSFDACRDYLASFKKTYFEKHVLLEVSLLLIFLIGLEVYLLYFIHVDLVDGIYNFLIREIVIDNLSSKYIRSLISLFTTFSVVIVVLHFTVLGIWIFAITRKIMLTNFGYVRMLKGLFKNFPGPDPVVFTPRKNDPTLDCAKSFQELLNSPLARNQK